MKPLPAPAPEVVDYGPEGEALLRVLTARFAVSRLRSLAWISLNAAALPSLVLWIDGFVALPAAVVGLAAVAWAGCAALTIASATSEWSVRRRLEAALPAARLAARVSLAAARPGGAGTFAVGAALVSGALWLPAVAPSLLPAGVPALARVAWAMLMAATIGSRRRELGIKKTSRARAPAFTPAEPAGTVPFEERNHHGTGRPDPSRS